VTGETSALERCRLDLDSVCFSILPQDIAPESARSKNFAVIGQDRAMLALRLALSIREKGYNVFVSGPAGTGKRTAVFQVLSELPTDLSRLKDIALRYDFKHPDAPALLVFPPGEARSFREDLKGFVDTLGASLRGFAKQDQFKSVRDKLLLASENEEQQLIFDFEGRLSREGFQIVRIDEEDEQSTDILPLVEGEVSDFDELQKKVASGEMKQSAYEQLREQYFGLVDEMQDVFRTISDKRAETMTRLRDLRLSIVWPGIQDSMSKLEEDYPYPEIKAFLKDLSDDLRNSDGPIAKILAPDESEEDQDSSDKPSSVLELMRATYDINILVDHEETKELPRIFEQYPDAAKLFGTVENPQDPEKPFAPHMLVRAGSLLRASGGFLILRAEDLVRDEEVYVAFKRILSEQAIEIKATNGPMGPQGPAVKPVPIPIDLKVIVMAPDGLYEMLFERDEEFQKLFKVPADFDWTVTRSPEIARSYADFFSMIQAEDKLPPVDDSGVCALLEFAARDAESRTKLSTRFSILSDLLHESAHSARETGDAVITRRVVEAALATRKFLYNLPEEKIDEQISDGEILMELKGTAVGRVNGLAVMDRGFYSFGRPTVISAQVAPGSEGVINIEHEAGLSGEIHDKGAFIVGAFVQATYARSFPLSVRASIVFEQSYTEVDGDSASSAEIYALLSAIGNIPLRQDLAVTGSVNQMGQIQPVGGVVDKIEGFFEICRKTGLTGTQGVIIPVQNVNNLVLVREVQEAVKAGKFNIFAIRTINDGLEILTGLPGGVRNAKGKFPEGSLNGIVEHELRNMAETIKEFGS